MDDVKTEVVSPDDIKMKKRKRFHLEDDDEGDDYF